MTYKIFGILKRPNGMTFEQFKKWWLEVHVPRVLKWPNIVAYDVNFALNEDEPFDGVGVVCFDTKEAAESVFQTLEGVARVLPPLPSQAKMPSSSPKKLPSCREQRPTGIIQFPRGRLCPLMARLRHLAMSAPWSLTGGKRTSCRQPNLVEIDSSELLTC